MDVLRKLEAYLKYILGCAHLLFQLWTFSLCIHCKTKIHWFHKKKIVDFENLLEIEICWRQIFKILIIHKPSLGSCEVPQKIWAESVQPFLNTNKQTFRQTDKQSIYLYTYSLLLLAPLLQAPNDLLVLRRKEAKSYGTKKMVEGVWTEGQNCVIVEDVVTTGIPTTFQLSCGHIVHL